MSVSFAGVILETDPTVPMRASLPTILPGKSWPILLVRTALRIVPGVLVASLFWTDAAGFAQAPVPAHRPAGRRNQRGRQAAQPSPNTLPRLFQNLFGGGSPKPASEEGAAADHHGPRDMIDGRVPHNPSQAKQLEHAELLIAGGHWDQALERLEFLLASSDRATIRTADGRPGLVAWEANRLLGQLPASALETYRLRHEAQAAQMLDDAQKDGQLGPDHGCCYAVFPHADR